MRELERGSREAGADVRSLVFWREEFPSWREEELSRRSFRVFREIRLRVVLDFLLFPLLKNRVACVRWFSRKKRECITKKIIKMGEEKMCRQCDALSTHWYIGKTILSPR